MPNWCSTSIEIYHDSSDELKFFDEKIDELTSYNYIKNGFGEKWLGNLVGNSGIGVIPENNVSGIKCRGSITYKTLRDDCLYIETETAWAPMLEVWLKLIDKYISGAQILYVATEPGCELYWTNDPGWLRRYVIIDCDDDYVNDDATEHNVVEFLQEKFGTSEEDVSKLMRILKESSFRNDIFIHQYEYVNEYSCD